MMPDLGKYAVAIGGAYAAATVLLVLLVALSLWKAAVVKRALKEIEDRVGKERG